MKLTDIPLANRTMPGAKVMGYRTDWPGGEKPQPAAEGRKARVGGSTGKTLEAMIERGGACVTLSRVPNGMKFIRKGVTIHQPTPCDFAGTITGTGRAIWLDAKEDRAKTSFNAKDDHVKPHQVEALIRHGQAGAVAGLLIRNVTTERLHWLDWRLLVDKRPTYPWQELADVGDAMAYQVNWGAVISAANREASAAR